MAEQTDEMTGIPEALPEAIPEEVTQEPVQEIVDEGPTLVDQFLTACPELSPMSEQLTPETMTALLIERLAATNVGTSRTEAPAVPPAPSTVDIAQQLPLVPPPSFDLESWRDSMKGAIDNGDSDAMVKQMESMYDMVGYVVDLSEKAVTASQNEVQRLSKEVRNVALPNEYQMVLPEVPSATANDVPAARAILESGRVKTVADSLQLAVFERQQELARATPKQAGDIARRRALALQAAQQAGGSRGMGETTSRIPDTTEDFEAMYRRQAAENTS